jgi:hypothetical protein
LSLSVVYYSNNRVPPRLQQFCFDKLRAAVRGELICIIRPQGASHRAMYEQILAGIAAAAGDIIALAEHDVLYPTGYFDVFANATGITYNTNVWCLNHHGYFRPNNPHLLSNCGAPRAVLARAIRRKLREGVPKWAEPEADAELTAPHPTIDIRHGRNFTGDRHAPSYRKKIPYWGDFTKYPKLWLRSER